jgi:hypothetical protein
MEGPVPTGAKIANMANIGTEDAMIGPPRLTLS